MSEWAIQTTRCNNCGHTKKHALVAEWRGYIVKGSRSVSTMEIYPTCCDRPERVMIEARATKGAMVIWNEESE